MGEGNGIKNEFKVADLNGSRIANLDNAQLTLLLKGTHGHTIQPGGIVNELIHLLTMHGFETRQTEEELFVVCTQDIGSVILAGDRGVTA